MEDHSKHFPESLSGSLQRFTDFYTKRQCVLGSDLSQARRLQWTWLGYAELQYGDLTLHVSTLQMFILLHFNHQQGVSEEEIIGRTGVSGRLLCQALTPLTGERAILTRHKERGLLRLNDSALAERAPGKVVRLLPRQMYLNVEEDEGRTLERKRNIIFCLITKIMKEEKELHIDNLVFKVRQATRVR
ncbi:cullin-7-like [Ascaphus truei]|uniref:cullin-7-like n=1 Tax=Ascaphus truei TaxID=8439 RepID=UPI003F592E98